MLPEFISLGYNERDFLSDYYVNKLTTDDISKIKRHYTNSILFEKFYNASAVDFFIGKYFAAKSCPNKSYDYQSQMKELTKIDLELFQIIETFLTEWKKFDYNDTDPIAGSYHSFLFDFIENLKKWTEGKTIK